MTETTFNSITVNYLDSLSGFSNLLKGMQYGVDWYRVFDEGSELPYLDKLRSAASTGKSLLSLPASFKQVDKLISDLFMNHDGFEGFTLAFNNILDTVQPISDVAKFFHDCELIELSPEVLQRLGEASLVTFVAASAISFFSNLGKVASDVNRIWQLQEEIDNGGGNSVQIEDLNAAIIRRDHDLLNLARATSFLALGIFKIISMYSGVTFKAPITLIFMTAALVLGVYRHYYDELNGYKDLPPLHGRLIELPEQYQNQTSLAEAAY